LAEVFPQTDLCGAPVCPGGALVARVLELAEVVLVQAPRRQEAAEHAPVPPLHHRRGRTIPRAPNTACGKIHIRRTDHNHIRILPDYLPLEFSDTPFPTLNCPHLEIQLSARHAP